MQSSWVAIIIDSLFLSLVLLQRRLNVNRINSAVIVINLTIPIVYRPIINVI